MRVIFQHKEVTFPKKLALLQVPTATRNKLLDLGNPDANHEDDEDEDEEADMKYEEENLVLTNDEHDDNDDDEEYDYWEPNTKPTFKKDEFDNNPNKHNFRQNNSQTQNNKELSLSDTQEAVRSPSIRDVVNKDGQPYVIDQIYWSSYVENLVPKGRTFYMYATFNMINHVSCFLQL